MRSSLLIALLGMTIAASAQAQGTLSTQGYGYPPGQLSARAQGTAGAIGEGDPFSPLNPAAPSVFSGKFLTLQAEPEYRVVNSASESKRSSAARYPLFLGAMPVGEGWVVSLSSSTLLDRTWQTTATDTTVIGGESVESVHDHRVLGAMNDVRAALSWNSRRWLRVGLGVHAVTGRNVVSLNRTFPGAEGLAPFGEQISMSFAGSAVSGGVELVAVNRATLSLGYQVGGRVHARGPDTLFAAAMLPDRLGIGLAYTGLRGSTVAVRASHHGWSSLAPLGSASSTPVDAWDLSIGADVAGPTVVGAVMALRGGLRTRTLPYQAGGASVTERSAALGTGFAMARGRVLVDLAAIRAFRDAGLSINERAWTFSIGVSTRP